MDFIYDADVGLDIGIGRREIRFTGTIHKIVLTVKDVN